MAEESTGTQIGDLPQLHDNEGKTPAAWTTVILLIVAAVVGGFAVALGNWWLFWLGGVGGSVVALIVGKVMAVLGLGANPVESGRTEAEQVDPAAAAEQG